MDSEKYATSVDLAESLGASTASSKGEKQQELHRGLKARHIQMIALGGTIGTGLFMSSGKAVSSAGPGGALVAYAVLGLLVFCVMMSLGEMAAYIPVAGSFAQFATRFADPSLGFTVGWVYWANWAVGVAVELTGVAMIMEFWVQSVNSVVWSIFCLVILIVINVFSVKGYGEVEYWISFIKIVVVVIFIIVGICVDTGAAGGDHIGVRNFHLEGGAFPYGFLGVFNAFLTAAFSFNGVEIVGIAAGESQNPHKTVPAAVKQVFFRIVLFYILTMLIIGLCIPYTDPNLLRGGDNISVSPFTLVFQKAGAAWAADLMNAVILVTMISAGNSGVYSSSRTLLALAENGSAPRFFTRINRFGIPIWCIAASCFVGCLAFLTSLFGSGVVFTWLTNLTSVAGLITWVIISITHIGFRIGYRKQGRSLKDLPYVAPLFPVCDLFVIVIGLIIICGQGYHTFYAPIDAKDVVAAYIGVIFAVALYVGHKLWKRGRFFNRWEDMDFDSGTIPMEPKDYDIGTTKSLPLWRRIFNKIIDIIA